MLFNCDFLGKTGGYTLIEEIREPELHTLYTFSETDVLSGSAAHIHNVWIIPAEKFIEAGIVLVWKPYSLRGYISYDLLTDEQRRIITKGVEPTKCTIDRIPENGSLIFHKI